MILTVSAIVMIFVSIIVYAYVLIESFKLKLSIDEIDRRTREECISFGSKIDNIDSELTREIEKSRKEASDNLDAYKNLKRDEYNSLRASVAASARAAKKTRQTEEFEETVDDESELELKYKQTNNLDDLFGVTGPVQQIDTPRRLVRKG